MYSILTFTNIFVLKYWYYDIDIINTTLYTRIKSNFSPWPARQYIKESDTNGTSTVVFGSSMILQDD